jgi:transcriptional regulator with XRE-family HTH domain
VTISGRQVRAARMARGLPVRVAAAQAGVSPGLWSDIENGNRAPGPHATPLLEAWLADTPEPFPAHRVDDAIRVIERYRPVLDAARVARIRAALPPAG